MKVAVIDYGMGNLRSVTNAFNRIGVRAYLAQEATDIQSSSHIVLPGQGAFPQGIKNITEKKIDQVLKDEILLKHKPFLGICLGMQLLGDISYEMGSNHGLGLISGDVIRISQTDNNLKIPHIGWDSIKYTSDCPLFVDLNDDLDYYFVHSYYLQPKETDYVVATCTYGETYPVAIWKKNIFATLFHPEKSQNNGLKILRNFINYSL